MKKCIHLLTAGFLLASSPVVAGVRDDVMAAMQRCSVISDDRTWLDCTYGAQQLMRAKLGLSPAPEFQQRLVPSASAAPTQASVANSDSGADLPAPRRRSGGLMGLFAGDSTPVAVSAIVALRYDNQGAFVATLANGQVWRQKNVQPGYPRASLMLGSKVKIVPAALGSYNLETDGKTRHTYKVNREA